MMCPRAEYHSVSLCWPGLVSGWLFTQTSILLLVNYELFHSSSSLLSLSLCIWSLNRRQIYIMGYAFLMLGACVPRGAALCLVFAQQRICYPAGNYKALKATVRVDGLVLVWISFINLTTSCSAVMFPQLKEHWYILFCHYLLLQLSGTASQNVGILRVEFGCQLCRISVFIFFASVVTLGCSHVGVSWKLVGGSVWHMAYMRDWKIPPLFAVEGDPTRRQERIWSSDLPSLERENAFLCEHAKTLPRFQCFMTTWDDLM